jgi:hypothetical protein
MKRLCIVSPILVIMHLSMLACAIGDDVVGDTPASTFTQSVPTHTPLSTLVPPPVATETPLPTATSVPPTLPPTATTASTVEPTSHAVVLKGPTVSFNGISFVLDPGLGDTVYASASSDYVDGYTCFSFASAGYCYEVGCVQVYDVQAYEKAYPGRPMPPVGAAVILLAQKQSLEFQSGSGTRAVKMYAQNIYWVHNDAIRYEYRGLTEDGQYYVVVTSPVDAPILLSGSDPEQNTNEGALPLPLPLPADPDARDKLIREYNQVAERQLDQLAAEDFVPDLGVLDALVTSISIGPPS